MGKTTWTLAQDAVLREHSDWTIGRLATTVGHTVNATRNRRSRIGAIGDRRWTKAEDEALIRAYDVPKGAYVELADICIQLNRTRMAVQTRAQSMGLGDIHRQRVPKRKGDPMFANAEERRVHNSKSRKEWHRNNPHPRGALGIRHNAETRAKISAAVRAADARLAAAGKPRTSDAERQRRSDRMSERMHTDERLRKGFSRANSGYREDLGIYVRSAWEANYARYLNWLVGQKQIKSWRYEPITFWFEAIKRGVRSYKPDFEVVNLDDSIEYHEVKGWDYARGQTARKRMAKYHPKVKLVLIGEEEYKALAKWKGMIPNWETKRRKPVVDV